MGQVKGDDDGKIIGICKARSMGDLKVYGAASEAIEWISFTNERKGNWILILFIWKEGKFPDDKKN